MLEKLRGGDCEILRDSHELAALPAEEYASRTEDERSIDSMLFKAIEYYHSVGGKDELLKKYDNYNRLDMGARAV